MKLVCHIGPPKTATTFLQNTCLANPKALARRGLVYPDLLSIGGNHITLYYAASSKIHKFRRYYGLDTKEGLAQFRTKMKQQIADQIEAAPAGTHTMVVSSENLANKLGGPGVKNLAEIFAPLFSEVRILLYARRQDDALLSLYAEAMRSGFSSKSIDDFIDAATQPKSIHPQLGYMPLLRRWEAAFGRDAITVRRFDRKDMLGGDILADFIGQISGKMDDDVSDFTRSPQSNSSLSAPVLEYLRRLHAKVPHTTSAGVNPDRRKLIQGIDSLPTEPRPHLSKAQSVRIMKRYSGGNRWLRDTYFPDQKGPLFTPPGPMSEVSNLGIVSDEDSALFTTHLLKSLPSPLRKRFTGLLQKD